MLKTKEEIENWLNQYHIKNYTVNKDLTVDVEGFVNISFNTLCEIPIKFNKINGNFDCSVNRLTSLEFCPRKINGNFNCSHNNISTFDHFPMEINGDVSFLNNNIIKQVLHTFNSNIKGDIESDLGDKENFLILVRKQKILHEKKVLNNKLYSTKNSQLIKKRL